MLEQPLMPAPKFLLYALAVLHVTRMTKRRASPKRVLLPTTRSQLSVREARLDSLEIHSEERKTRALVSFRVHQQVSDVPKTGKELPLIINWKSGLQ